MMKISGMLPAWEFEDNGKWKLNKEELEFESLHLAQRSYK